MRVVYKLRKDIEDKLNRLPLSYFDTRQRGDLMSRVTNDVDNIQNALQQAFTQLVQSLLTVIGIVDHDVHRLLAAGVDRVDRAAAVRRLSPASSARARRSCSPRSGRTPAP